MNNVECKPCCVCGGAVKRPKRGPTSIYCSRKCRYSGKQYGKNTPAKCLVCGADMIGYPGRKYCAACRYIGRFVTSGTKWDLTDRACGQCGATFRPKRPGQRFCGIDCLQAHNAKTQGVGPHTCLECGAEFKHRWSSRQANRYCSRDCAVKASRDRARTSGRRTAVPCVPKGGHYEDRARGYGVTVEKVDVLAVFERDGWICGICRGQVDKHLSWPDPMSPSLDHVTPLSKGGGHTEDNVQCAHLRCNSVKRDRVAA